MHHCDDVWLMPATGFDPVTFRLWGDNHQSFGCCAHRIRWPTMFRRSAAELYRLGISQLQLLGIEPDTHLTCRHGVCQLSHEGMLLRTAWNIMQRNAYTYMSIPGWPPSSRHTFSFPSFFPYSLNDSAFIPLFNAHDILSTHVHAFFHLFSFFKHLGREKFKINNHCIYAVIIYWEMAHVMRNGSCIEESTAMLCPATNIIISFCTIGAFQS